MAKTTLTFELGGQVEIKHFEKGVSLFSRLIYALTPRGEVEWIVRDLQPGSATITLEGEADVESKVEQVVENYDEIGRHIQTWQNWEYQDAQTAMSFDKGRALKVAREIVDFANSVEYVRFRTPDNDYIITGRGVSTNVNDAVSVSIGAITGIVQTLSSRNSLMFNLYDALHNKRVACYMEEGQEELMREAWGRRVRVSGSVSRETDTGKPVAVRQILNVEILSEVAAGSYRQARGAVPWQSGFEKPEEAIRQMRDA